mmetsp:Transcript_89936/g.291056  ORF Transcript_89936/g.291056 Transcript_89936/m.291056 type:complete len:294 (-) Transcript_89936:41-922(-)
MVRAQHRCKVRRARTEHPAVGVDYRTPCEPELNGARCRPINSRHVSVESTAGGVLPQVCIEEGSIRCDGIEVGKGDRRAGDALPLKASYLEGCHPECDQVHMAEARSRVSQPVSDEDAVGGRVVLRQPEAVEARVRAMPILAALLLAMAGDEDHLLGREIDLVERGHRGVDDLLAPGAHDVAGRQPEGEIQGVHERARGVPALQHLAVAVAAQRQDAVGVDREEGRVHLGEHGHARAALHLADRPAAVDEEELAPTLVRRQKAARLDLKPFCHNLKLAVKRHDRHLVLVVPAL